MTVERKSNARCRIIPNAGQFLWTIGLVGVLLSFIAVSIAGPHAAASGAMISDSAIRQAIETYFDTEIDAGEGGVAVHVDDGVVMLSGTMENLLQKTRARKIAESVKGVRAVVDDTHVKLSLRDDAAIAADIRRNLEQARKRQGTAITVAVDNGVATLSGKVDSWVLSRMAARKARSVIGVTAVVNRLDVAPSPHRNDRAIQRDVMRRLDNDLYVDASRIDVTVKDGRVILSGTATTVAQKRRAEENAWITGVVDVQAQDLDVERFGKVAPRRPSPYTPRSDLEILKAVEDALRMDPRVNPTIPRVDVVNGAVTLSGPVDTLYAKRAAVEDARNTTGVWRVDNQLRLRYRALPSDAEIKRLIEDVFRRDAELHVQHIAVKVEDNHVTLAGSVNTMGQKVRTENIVSQINGVLTVENHIKVIAGVHPASDAEIAAAISNELYWSPYVDSDRLTVSVEDGRATLKGRVADRFVARIAVQNAFEGGAQSVRTHLILNDGGVLAELYDTKPAPRPGAAWWLRL